jgi:hypothetical protein
LNFESKLLLHNHQKMSAAGGSAAGGSAEGSSAESVSEVESVQGGSAVGGSKKAAKKVGSGRQATLDGSVGDLTLKRGSATSSKPSSSTSSRSLAWEYFEVVLGSEPAKLKCIHAVPTRDGTTKPCGFVMARPNSGTGNLTRHLEKVHPAAYIRVSENSSHSQAHRNKKAAAFAAAVGEAEPSGTGKGGFSMPETVRQAHHRRYVIMCVADLRPCSMASQPGFKIFLAGFSPVYVSQASVCARRCIAGG